MAPKSQSNASKGKGKRAAGNQGQNPTSTTPNQSQGSGGNSKGKQPATPQSSQGARRRNGKKKPAPAGNQVPLHLRVTKPSQSPHNPAGQPTQSSSGPSSSQSPKPSNTGKGRQQQQPSGPTTPLAGPPASKLPSGAVDPSSRQFDSRLAAMREGSVAKGTPARESGLGKAGVQSGTNVANPTNAAVVHRQKTARRPERPAVRTPVCPAPGAWATYMGQISAHDEMSDLYVQGGKGLDSAALEKMLADSSRSGEEKLQKLKEVVLALGRICEGRNQTIRALKEDYARLFPRRELWEEEKEIMLSLANQRENEILQQLDKAETRCRFLLEENLELKAQLESKEEQSAESNAVKAADWAAIAGGEVAEDNTEVGENGLEQQVPTKSELEIGDEALTQAIEAAKEITTAGKHVECLRDAAAQVPSEDDKNLGDLEADQAVERNLLVSLESEGVVDASTITEAPVSEFVEASTQTAPAASVEVVDTSMQTVKVEVAVLEALTQTEADVPPETSDSLVQTEPVIISEGRWGRGLLLVFLMLLWAFITLWGRSGDQQIWLEANTVVSEVGGMSAWPFWLQELRFDLSDWLQIDRVMLG
ncbi:uncharacterized protein CIMG_06118 [Coccidioides immitis RS]|uniref:Uncharacterized protein n=3 Tax=Coccidioides immitis TaxID=5501 RepID=J3K7G6_COCIM|nr:uncharacterized protein CIMG_06118 [Coccidioides immitis RS]EAS30639.3 hypothetical protein CIMG_06118 [Coccidioides immitis RS]KMP03197.1 hypothetical protein CIRG_02889 [Coccidioides immitis RMSCC 2394]KMU84775.1 hypothetical protein CIHG_02558 [Coccidioides immitis H538.4]TPX23566.1 hypothetical protein DIZ76_012900 [Coccidioides immitis]